MAAQTKGYLQPSKAHPQWLTSSSYFQPPKSSMASQNSSISRGSNTQNMSLWRDLSNSNHKKQIPPILWYNFNTWILRLRCPFVPNQRRTKRLVGGKEQRYKLSKPAGKSVIPIHILAPQFRYTEVVQHKPESVGAVAQICTPSSRILLKTRVPKREDGQLY